MQGRRERQEDFYAFCPTEEGAVLAVVADGMGGHPGGAEAAQVAVTAFVGAYTLEAEKASIAPPLSLDMLHTANRAVAKEAKANPKLAGMGCTLIAALVRDAGMEWISVGDSLLYLFSDGQLAKLNEDHSVNGVLHSALTGRDMRKIDHSAVEFPRGNVLVVAASDGILTLDECEIASVINTAKAQGADAVARGLIEETQSRRAPYQDNTTILAVAQKAR